MSTSTFSLGKTISNTSKITLPDLTPGGGGDGRKNLTIKVARTADIILDSSHPKWKENGEWDSVGLIYYSNISSNINDAPGKAKPLFPNIKHYPLVNEIVYLITLPTPEAQLINLNSSEKTQQNTTYYFPPVNIWNSTHHNAVPLIEPQTPSSILNDYTSSLGGLVRQVSDGSTDIPLNSPLVATSDQTFKEKINIQSLQPYPGDHIIEGRWGNSIRFGSTVSGSYVNSGWSDFGENGNPITIIRNGATLNDSPGWEFIVEDINGDMSSIWLTNEQKINIKPSSENYTSYVNTTAPEKPNEFTGNQVILNSGRLFFNSKNDHIMFSSQKSINLNAIESVNIDAIQETVINSPRVFLGGVDSSQPVVKGDDLINTLNDILSDLSSLTKALRDTTVKQFGPLGTANIIAGAIHDKISGYKDKLKQSLSDTTKTV